MRVCLRNFFEDLPMEIEKYLTEVAANYVEACIWDAPDYPIGFLEVKHLLEFELDENDWLRPIPTDEELTDRIFAAVKEKHKDELLTLEPFGFFPSEKWRASRHKAPDSSPTSDWMRYRTFIIGYDQTWPN
jgi:hypothetical protein